MPEDLPDSARWEGWKAIGVAISNTLRNGQDCNEVRYYILSKYISAKRFAEAVRGHWSIENRLHWVLDVIFDEDRARSRKDNAPQNLALLRKLALNMLRSHPDSASIRRKIKRAGWEDAFLINMLTQMR